MRLALRSYLPWSPGHPWGRPNRAATIRSQILLAFLVMSVITASLGVFSVRDLEREGALVDRTYDRSLMSINFARAAAADFNALQATIARRALTKDPAARAVYDRTVAQLEATTDDDLSVAVERAQSARVASAARKVQQAVKAWAAAEQAAPDDATADPAAVWATLDRQASVVGQQLDLLVNYTAGDGFTYRQIAHATVRNDRRMNIAATVLAVLMSGVIAWLLSRRVVSPIKQASEIARQIAAGDLGVEVPVGKADELGALLAAMEVMRGNIKASMELEVELRRSAQTRLADALEGSREGIVVVDAESRIALANPQASRLLDPLGDPLAAGDPAEPFIMRLASLGGTIALDYATPQEVELPDGRWLRISRSKTHENGSIFVYSDISLVKAQQAALKTANSWLDAALANLSHGLCLFDSANQLKVFNHRFCEIFDLPWDQVRQGMTLSELVDLGQGLHGQKKSTFIARIETRIAARKPADELLQMIGGRTLSVSHRPLDDDSWLATYEDVTESLQAAEKIAYMARHDALTGLPNRALFAERIELALASAADGEGFALLCLDLDHFKEVNDTLGHPIGDELLCVVAERLRGAIRESDTVARLGGDEFAIIQAAVGRPEPARSLARRIIEALAAPFQIGGNPVSIGASIGISMAPTDGRSYDVLLKNADLALYRAKAEGRNALRFFERTMDERQQARRLIELDLREALAQDQLELDYQPVFEVAEDKIRGFEALVRWRHPIRGLVAPSDFIPVAEEMGLITQIGAWVMRRACRDAAGWPKDISVAVNVSAAQLRHGGLHETVVDALARSGLGASRLVLEITESVLIANAQNALVVLDKLKAMGIRIAMDDFGTGYSSLSYLRSFPFDNVKIDKSFIRDVTTRPEAASIVRAVIALCASLGMRTTAEGIETEGQLAFLKAEGCDEAQGFFFSKPMAADAVPALLQTQTTLTDFFATTIRAA